MRALKELVETAKGDPDILAAFRYGSHARDAAGPESDIDVCLVLARKMTGEEQARKLWEYLNSELDVRLYQAIPLWLRQRVLKEGKLLFVKDEDQLYDLAFHTIREWEDFKHIYYEYLEGVAHGS